MEEGGEPKVQRGVRVCLVVVVVVTVVLIMYSQFS